MLNSQFINNVNWIKNANLKSNYPNFREKRKEKGDLLGKALKNKIIKKG